MLLCRAGVACSCVAIQCGVVPCVVVLFVLSHVVARCCVLSSGLWCGVVPWCVVSFGVALSVACCVGCFALCVVLCCAVLVCWRLAVWCGVVLYCWFRQWLSCAGVCCAVSVGAMQCPPAPCCLVRCCVVCPCAVLRWAGVCVCCCPPRCCAASCCAVCVVLCCRALLCAVVWSLVLCGAMVRWAVWCGAVPCCVVLFASCCPAPLKEVPGSGCYIVCKSCSLTLLLLRSTENWFLSKSLHVPVRCELCREERKNEANRHKQERSHSNPKIVTHQTFLPNVFSKNPWVPLSNFVDNTANSSEFSLCRSNSDTPLFPYVVAAESKEAICPESK